MIIGTDIFKAEEIRKFVHNPDGVVAYSDSTIPLWARHIPNIQNNQRYFYAIKVRGLLSLPYKSRHLLIDKLIDGVSISGDMTQIVPVTALLEACDKEALITLVKERLKDGYD